MIPFTHQTVLSNKTKYYRIIRKESFHIQINIHGFTFIHDIMGYMFAACDQILLPAPLHGQARFHIDRGLGHLLVALFLGRYVVQNRFATIFRAAVEHPQITVCVLAELL